MTIPALVAVACVAITAALMVASSGKSWIHLPNSVWGRIYWDAKVGALWPCSITVARGGRGMGFSGCGGAHCLCTDVRDNDISRRGTTFLASGGMCTAL